MSRIIQAGFLRPFFSSELKVAKLFLRLPSSYRSFHASPRSEFVEASIGAAHNVFEGLHSTTGLPWAYTIPLAALAIRMSIVLPFAMYTRRIAQKQIALSPLILAWQHTLQRKTMEEVGHLGPVVAESALLKKAKRKRKEIFRRFGCNEWKNYLPQVIQIPVWLTAIEALREMCGKQEGLLRMVTKLFTSSYPLATPSIVERSLSVEQSFATEGALWFPNLMVADPQMILPFMLSGVILLNLTKATGTTVWQKRLKRSLGVVALVLGPLTLQFPSALLIYWISSSTLAYVQDALLSRYMPVKPPVVPCKPRRPRMLSVGKIKVDLR